MNKLRLIHDRDRHGTATLEPQHTSLDVGCPSLPGCEDFSPIDLVCVGLASCMVFSMGSVARRNELDISRTEIEIDFTTTNKPFPHIDSISLQFNIPRDFAPEDRQKLERAAGLCPIKTSFRPETVITTRFNYGSEKAAVA